jgi:hypothetical protein
LETVYRDYALRGVRFYYVYKALAHPETNGYVTPFSLEERLMHVREAERRLGSGITWLCDTMANDTKHALGGAPNSEFLIDPEGLVVRRRAWSNPAQLRRDLEELVGPVDPITRVADLNLPFIPPPKAAPSGIVPRLILSGRFQPLRVTPHAAESAEPFYAKLRAEADLPLLQQGTGKLYLGFLLDPLYGVHWNNLAAPLQFSITGGEGVVVTPASATGPQVEVEADIDPREFLVDVATSGNPSGTTLQVRVDYFACHDEQGWCKPVSQNYTLTLAVDPDGGWVQARQRPQAKAKAKSPRKGLPPGQQLPGRPVLANRADQVFGTIQQLDPQARIVSVQLPGGGIRAAHVAEDVLIDFHGESRPLSVLQPGDRVLIQLRQAVGEGETGEAARIMARRR